MQTSKIEWVMIADHWYKAQDIKFVPWEFANKGALENPLDSNAVQFTAQTFNETWSKPFTVVIPLEEIQAVRLVYDGPEDT